MPVNVVNYKKNFTSPKNTTPFTLTNKTNALFRFEIKYIYLFCVLFIIELGIAKYINDVFIRPFIGDVLVVVLIYCFLRAFLNVPSSKVALGVFVFACCIELLQAIHFVSLLGFEGCKPIAIALGSTFDVKDILAYLVGYGLCRLPFFSH